VPVKEPSTHSPRGINRKNRGKELQELALSVQPNARGMERRNAIHADVAIGRTRKRVRPGDLVDLSRSGGRASTAGLPNREVKMILEGFKHLARGSGIPGLSKKPQKREETKKVLSCRARSGT